MERKVATCPGADLCPNARLNESIMHILLRKISYKCKAILQRSLSQCHACNLLYDLFTSIQLRSLIVMGRSLAGVLCSATALPL